MSGFDSIVALVVIVTFLSIVGSKIYDHEKEHLDPIIKKVRGWFGDKEEADEIGPNDDFDISFKGQMQD